MKYFLALMLLPGIAVAELPQQIPDTAIMENEEFLLKKLNRLDIIVSTVGGDVFKASTQTFTGGNSLQGSTTFYGTVNLPVNSKIILSDTIHVSSFGVLTNGMTSTNTTFTGCHSTRTIITQGSSNIWVSFGGTSRSDGAAYIRMTILVDGVSLTAAGVPFWSQGSDPSTVSYNWVGLHFPVYVAAAGSHSVCIGLWTSGSTARIDAELSYPYFAIEEHR